MSFTGRVDASCPGCSEENEFEIWSFVRGDQDETLKERLKGGELNVLECPNCGRLYYPQSSWVYADPTQDLLAFVFPESFEAEAGKWRDKMRADFEQMKPVTDKLGFKDEPLLFFGAEGLAGLIHHLESLEDEAEVAGFFAKEHGLTMRRVAAGFARAHSLPRELPFAAGRVDRKAALEGVTKLVQANDRLEGYRRWQQYLKSPEADPPWSKA